MAKRRAVPGSPAGNSWGRQTAIQESRPSTRSPRNGIIAVRRASELRRPPTPGAVDALRLLADTPADSERSSWRAVVDPRRWPVQRSIGVAALNGAVAAGIGVGFDPLP